MPAAKLMGRRPIGADNRKKGVLCVTTTSSRYLLEFPWTPELFSSYLQWHKSFFASLDTRVEILVTLRPHHEDQGWGIAARLAESFPKLRIEDWSVPFLKSLNQCRLYVCDHLSTTFGEALAADKPTVMFWNSEGNELRDEARPYFDSLRRTGVLYHDPVEAASCVNHVYDDVEKWWHESSRQQARRDFCNRFARTAPDAVGLWNKEFRNVLRTPSVIGAGIRPRDLNE